MPVVACPETGTPTTESLPGEINRTWISPGCPSNFLFGITILSALSSFQLTVMARGFSKKGQPVNNRDKTPKRIKPGKDNLIRSKYKCISRRFTQIQYTADCA